MTSSARLSSLDGLRGVAALIVVVHHCLLVSPSLAAVYYGGDVTRTPLGQALAYTPLHLVWGGAEAVVVFFVLSGVVLTRATRSARFDWFAYVPSRLVRLYLPVAGAVAVAFLLLLLPHDGGTSSPWLDRAAGYPLPDIIRDLTIVGGTSGVVSPLWTLRWEVVFSVMLPVAAFALRVIPGWLLGVLSIGLSALGAAANVGALQYLPIFGVGVAIAGEWDRIGALVARMPRRAALVVWPGAVVAIVLLLSASWTLTPLLGHGIASSVSQTPVVLGAAVLVIAAVHCPWLRRMLSWRAIAWLGAISFSLYLVHEPLVVLFANVTNGALPTLLIAVPVALAAAWLFSWVVERPAHRLAQRIRARAARVQPARARGRTASATVVGATTSPSRM